MNEWRVTVWVNGSEYHSWFNIKAVSVMQTSPRTIIADGMEIETMEVIAKIEEV